MSLQAIIDICSRIEIDRRRIIGIQYTRNESPRVSETPSRNPWKITLTAPSSLRYSEARAIIEAIDTLDRSTPEVVGFNNNPNMNWIFKYQGDLNPAQVNQMTVSTYVGNQLVLTDLPTVPSSSYLFRKGDFIQIGNFKYPFTTRTDILRGSGTTVTITTSRPNIIASSVAGLGVTVGSNVRFTMFCPDMPTYSLVPGGQVFNYDTGVVDNNALIEWSGQFTLYEYVGISI
jgi:hypothetical protein